MITKCKLSEKGDRLTARTQCAFRRDIRTIRNTPRHHLRLLRYCISGGAALVGRGRQIADSLRRWKKRNPCDRTRSQGEVTLINRKFCKSAAPALPIGLKSPEKQSAAPLSGPYRGREQGDWVPGGLLGSYLYPGAQSAAFQLTPSGSRHPMLSRTGNHWAKILPASPSGIL
jgi:hypothetical protein